jgi:ABC-type branched-subunit amino acid transport system substrate-binding protein
LSKRIGSVIAAVLLVATACSRSGSTTTTSVGPTTTAAPAAGDFGTLKAVCGPGNATGATDLGVTNTTIDIGTQSDPGAVASPGLNQELFDSSTAFVKWCNDAGGILGRKINLHLRDAKLFEVGQRTLEACAQDFAEVGGGTAFDDQGVDARVKCKLAEIDAYDDSPKATEAPLKVQATPLPIQQQQDAMFLGALHSDPTLKRAGFLVGNIPAVEITQNRLIDAAQQAGFQAVYNNTFPIAGVDNWRPYVQALQSAKVDVFSLTASPAELIAIEKAMKDVGFYPKLILESGNMYDDRVIKEGGDAIQNTYVLNSFFPFEEASAHPATQQYLDLMHKELPNGKIAALGLNSWDSWLLFATAARDCGSTLTRDCLLTKAAANPMWTGGGLGGPVDTSTTNRQMTQCYMLLKATPTGWVRDTQLLVPNQGELNCDPANVVTLKGNYLPKS